MTREEDVAADEIGEIVAAHHPAIMRTIAAGVDTDELVLVVVRDGPMREQAEVVYLSIAVLSMHGCRAVGVGPGAAIVGLKAGGIGELDASVLGGQGLAADVAEMRSRDPSSVPLLVVSGAAAGLYAVSRVDAGALN